MDCICPNVVIQAGQRKSMCLLVHVDGMPHRMQVDCWVRPCNWSCDWVHHRDAFRQQESQSAAYNVAYDREHRRT
jgi:hypothetical protein